MANMSYSLVDLCQRILNYDNFSHDLLYGPVKEEGVATRYFVDIFKAGDCDRLEECLAAVHPKVCPDMRDLLSSAYSPEEIKAAVFQMGPTKAPGPDDCSYS
uniref:Uncharacterized protein n=1 Tax=Quercus lobata TaxID=97700 RepID=A0A7N2MJN3_QUELO